MKKTFLLGLALLSVSMCSAQSTYTARDLTKENLFTENIEGPNYRDGILYVVNYQKDGTIGAVKPNGEVELYVTLPEGSIANAIQFDKSGNMLLPDFKAHNILKVDKKTKAVTVYSHTDKFNQPNDICISKKGYLFASDPNWKESTGQIWRIETDGKAVLLKDQMGTTNGIELSPDEKTLYVNESVQRKIWKFDVDEKGNISHQQLFAEVEDFGFDGMKCDAQGNVYVTRWGKGTVAIYTHEGELLREVEMKGKKTSNINFGGKDKKTCYVTLQDRKCVETFQTEVAGK
ncbi:MAG: gluconolactonase [Azospira oryzae]|jgi:gluconolactonase|nr:gluconolactonase [Cytophaga sp.]PZR35320.1 MAG: gluconolactonase [Azospira oryzae]